MNESQNAIPRHPIRVVARRTGLTPAVLRAWEKRYQVVEPHRSEGGQRLYSDEDVQRLRLLRKAVEEGRSISRVADLTTKELTGLVQEDEAGRVVAPPPEPLETSSLGEIFARATDAVRKMDPVRLERILTRGAMALPVPTMLDQVIAPLLVEIGDSWKSGRLGPAQEHMGSVVIRRFLEWLLGTVGVEEAANTLVSATPSGERHELGALLCAVSAAAEGWRGIFLGPDLPADEIAAAALALGADTVALSSVDPSLAGDLPSEVKELRARLPATVRVLVGGSNATRDPEAIAADGVEVLGSLEELRKSLRETIGEV